jgi:hypothetical protein
MLNINSLQVSNSSLTSAISEKLIDAPPKLINGALTLLGEIVLLMK